VPSWGREALGEDRGTHREPPHLLGGVVHVGNVGGWVRACPRTMPTKCAPQSHFLSHKLTHKAHLFAFGRTKAQLNRNRQLGYQVRLPLALKTNVIQYRTPRQHFCSTPGVIQRRDGGRVNVRLLYKHHSNKYIKPKNLYRISCLAVPVRHAVAVQMHLKKQKA
jgi:hypothetical protein